MRAPSASAPTASTPPRLTTRWRAPARRSTGCARGTPTAALPLLRLPDERDDLADDPQARRAAARRRDRRRHPRHRRLEPRRPDAGAACRLRACRASARCATPPRLHFMDNLDPDSLRRAARAGCRSPTTRFVAISKSGGTGETLMQTIAALAAVKAAGLDAASPNCSSASPSRRSPASANGLRDLLGAHRDRRCSSTIPASAGATRC